MNLSFCALSLLICAILGGEFQKEVREELKEIQDELKGVEGEEEETITSTPPKITNQTVEVDASKLFFRGVKGYNPIGTGPSKAQLLSPSRKFPGVSLPTSPMKSSTQNAAQKATGRKDSSLPANIGGLGSFSGDSDEDRTNTTEDVSTTQEISMTTKESITVWMEQGVGSRVISEIASQRLPPTSVLTEPNNNHGKLLFILQQSPLFYVCMSFIFLFIFIFLFYNYCNELSFRENLLHESFYEEI